MRRMTGHQHMDDAFGSTRRLTYMDFRHFPRDGRRHELIDGRHYVTAPEFRHGVLTMRLTKAIFDHLDEHPVGELFSVPLDCILSFFDIVEPDLLLIANDQRGIITKRNLKGLPALVVEINSPSTRQRDRRIKRDLYARAGAREYWIIDPEANTVNVFRRSPKGAFPKVATLRAGSGKRLTSQVMPGFDLDLEHFFRD